MNAKVMDNKNERIELLPCPLCNSKGIYDTGAVYCSGENDWQCILQRGYQEETNRFIMLKQWNNRMSTAEVSHPAEEPTAQLIAQNIECCIRAGGTGQDQVIRMIGVALREAELRGACKMQEAAAKDCFDAAKETPDKHTEAGSFREAICLSRGKCIRALKPEEVIK